VFFVVQAETQRYKAEESNRAARLHVSPIKDEQKLVYDYNPYPHWPCVPKDDTGGGTVLGALPETQNLSLQPSSDLEPGNAKNTLPLRALIPFPNSRKTRHGFDRTRTEVCTVWVGGVRGANSGGCGAT